MPTSSPHFERFAKAATGLLGEARADNAADWLRELSPDARFDPEHLAMDIDADEGRDRTDFQALLEYCRDDLGFLVEVPRLRCDSCNVLVDRADVLASDEHECPQCTNPIPDADTQRPEPSYRLHPDAEEESRLWQAAQRPNVPSPAPVTYMTDNRIFNIGTANNSHFGQGDITNATVINAGSDRQDVLAAIEALVRSGVGGNWDADAAQATSEIIDARADIETTAVEESVTRALAGADERAVTKFGQSVAASTTGGVLVAIIRGIVGF